MDSYLGCRTGGSLKRPLSLLYLSLALVACHRDTPRPIRDDVPVPASHDEEAGATHIERRASFRTSAVRLTIEDFHMRTGFDEVLARQDAALVVNGGFFDPETQPLGLAISDGRTLSPFSRGMSGGVLWTSEGIVHLTATEDYEAGAVDFAIQCRPRLVVASRVNIHGDDGRRARRTAICVRDGGRTLEVVIAGEGRANAGPTLLELAEELVAEGCEEALNLDGGPSTGWASRLADGGVDLVPPRGPVRHVVVVRPQVPRP
jgi:Phosphodiester glycosidase